MGNKRDEQPLDINRKALQEKYPNIRAIIETSCQSGLGIEDLRKAITREVGNLKEVYDLLPLSWFEVKEHLEQMQEDFITYDRYTDICIAKTIPEENNQEQLIDLLHNLGLVLNYREHPILQSTNVLNPDWVTQGIYAILSDETLKMETKGVLTFDDLSRILDCKRYPKSRHYYLTELMKEFQLCFELLNRSKPTFLIPGLLPKEEPKDTNLKGDTLEFQYHYRILPESILSRFIVLTHEKIHNQTCWRTGVMLVYCEGGDVCNIARVRSDPEDKKIFISVSGRESTRRSFLLLIRDVFNQIHRPLENLEVTEWVPVPGHPEHTPLDYQELLGQEAMGEREVTIGKLRLRLNLRQLLDGYEPIELRQRARLEGDRSINNYYIQGDYQPMTDITNNNQGANIANNANVVRDNARQQANQHIHQAANPSLAETAKEIKALLDQLDLDYSRTTNVEQATFAAKAIEKIENNPTLKSRIVKALQEGGTTALETAVDHPAVKPVVAMIKGFMEG